MDIFVGNVISVGFNFTPVGFVPCDGRMLDISTNQVLYTLIGTTYGGDGVTTFGVPNLLGRTPVHAGQGPGLSNYVLGQSGGKVAATLTAANLPVHTHGHSQVHMQVNSVAGTTNNPVNSYLAPSDASIGNVYVTNADYPYEGATVQVSSTGGNLPVSIVNPFQAVNYLIATQGIYPTQN